MKTVLHGHVSPETAYLVEDYPYGFRLRCKMRYWLETAVKGAKKGEMRLMHQTSNPKRGDIWNKPKASNYSDLLVMYLDEQGHVHTAGISAFVWPDHYATFMADFGPQLSEEQRKHAAALATFARKCSPRSWVEWDAAHPGDN